MQQRKTVMSIYNMTHASQRAKDIVKYHKDMSDAMINDPDKIDRLRKHECIACYYTSKIGGRIGGAACTSKPCMSCGKNEMYGSTNTDELCLECAQKHSLCKHCGGDHAMRVRRKEWPKPVEVTE